MIRLFSFNEKQTIIITEDASKNLNFKTDFFFQNASQFIRPLELVEEKLENLKRICS